jgi:hypothetical protein
MSEVLLVAGVAITGLLVGLVYGYKWGFWSGYDEGHQDASYSVLGKFLPNLPPLRPRR